MACPICDKPTQQAVRPFCSKRCADVDLGKWFGGDYAIPSNDPDDIDAVEDALDAPLSDKPH